MKSTGSRANWLLCCVALLCACRDSEVEVRDSESRRFAVRCAGREAACSVKQLSGPVASGGLQPALRATGRWVGVCDAPRGAPPHLGDCRPLLCGSDAECPPLYGPSTGACVGGACVDPAHAMSVEDAILLCMAGTGLGHQDARQVERYALAQNCGDPCQIPAPCRQNFLP